VPVRAPLPGKGGVDQLVRLRTKALICAEPGRDQQVDDPFTSVFVEDDERLHHGGCPRGLIQRPVKM
jgi:hypothetical protein